MIGYLPSKGVEDYSSVSKCVAVSITVYFSSGVRGDQGDTVQFGFSRQLQCTGFSVKFDRVIGVLLPMIVDQVISSD